jgi:hypothetical protein
VDGSLKTLAQHAAENAPPPPEIAIYRKAVQELTRKLQARQSGEQAIKDAILEAYRNPPDLTIPKAPKIAGRGSPEIAVLHFSDGQIGKTTASFNTAVAEVRVTRAVALAAKIAELRRSRAKIERLVILMGGDEIEGESIFPGQAHQIDSGVFEQIKKAPEIYARAFLFLLQHFKKIDVYEVPGNHGRAAPRAQGSHPKTNWDNVCHLVLRTMLQPAGKRIEWHPNEHWFQVFETFGHKHLLVHGDQIRGGFAGFPWYGVGRKALAWGESIPEWTGQPRYLWHGHFHQCTSWPVGQIRVLGNGSLESHNEYARAEFGQMGQPEQRLAFFGPDHGLIADCPLYLGD